MDLNIFQEYWERFKKPWCISFVLYLIFIVIVFGGLGVFFAIFSTVEYDIWNIAALEEENKISILNNLKVKNITSNMATYSIATLIPAIITIFMSFLETKNKVSQIILSIVVIFVSVFLLYHSTSNNNAIAMLTASFSVILALFFWVIANYDNEYLNDKAFADIITNDMKKNHNADGKWNE